MGNDYKTLTEPERDSIRNFMRNLDVDGMETACREIPDDWIFYELTRRFNENKDKVQGMEMIMKGLVMDNAR